MYVDSKYVSKNVNATKINEEYPPSVGLIFLSVIDTEFAKDIADSNKWNMRKITSNWKILFSSTHQTFKKTDHINTLQAYITVYTIN